MAGYMYASVMLIYSSMSTVCPVCDDNTSTA